jgi:hypothetical protein
VSMRDVVASLASNQLVGDRIRVRANNSTT